MEQILRIKNRTLILIRKRESSFPYFVAYSLIDNFHFFLYEDFPSIFFNDLTYEDDE